MKSKLTESNTNRRSKGNCQLWRPNGHQKVSCTISRDWACKCHLWPRALRRLRKTALLTTNRYYVWARTLTVKLMSPWTTSKQAHKDLPITISRKLIKKMRCILKYGGTMQIGKSRKMSMIDFAWVLSIITKSFTLRPARSLSLRPVVLEQVLANRILTTTPTVGPILLTHMRIGWVPTRVGSNSSTADTCFLSCLLRVPKNSCRKPPQTWSIIFLFNLNNNKTKRTLWLRHLRKYRKIRKKWIKVLWASRNQIWTAS